MSIDPALLLAQPAFAGLEPHEAEAIAGVMSARHFEPGQTVIAAGSAPSLLHIAIGGYAVGPDGQRWPGMFDAAAVLLGQPSQGCVAGEEGLNTLTLARPYLFTLTREFPSLLRRLPVLARP